MIKNIVCGLLVCLTMTAGCSKSESKIYGVWVDNKKGISSMDFYSNHIGMHRDPLGITKFKWSMPADNKVKIEMEFLPKPSLYEMRGDKLICSESPDFHFIRKK